MDPYPVYGGKMICPRCACLMYVWVTPADEGPQYDLTSYECPQCGLWIDADKEGNEIKYYWTEKLIQ